MDKSSGAEYQRLEEDRRREGNWKRWGTYLSERQWGTVREDYSADGEAWLYLSHDQARSRAYRWGEDGLLGWTDRQCRLCFSTALWNGCDPILKERFYGLTGFEGNHGEDVKEAYYYLDATPTHSYCKALYKYPLTPFPYAGLQHENRARGYGDPEFELEDSGIFNEGRRYVDLLVEYAKGGPEETWIRLTLSNRGEEKAELQVLPTVWFRNTWAWGETYEKPSEKPWVLRDEAGGLKLRHPSLGAYHFDSYCEGVPPRWIFTENESNAERLFDAESVSPHVKDAFHELVVDGRTHAVNPAETGTKAAAWFGLSLEPGQSRVIYARLGPGAGPESWDAGKWEAVFSQRQEEADEFYRTCLPENLDEEARMICRQAWAGLLWSKQFYHYIVETWIRGDSTQPEPPPGRGERRNRDWPHFFARDVLSMPDKWEYPWFAAWDLAFHMIPMAQIDPEFAKSQLLLMLREWYMHPNGQLPAYEWNFDDVNPPVHAWAVWRVYKISGHRGERDLDFLERGFQKLLMNFTWWVNRKDPMGRNIFSGGFLGLDNIGVFDRSKPLPGGGHLAQADATAWMAFYCLTMLSMALKLAQKKSRAYEDIASKFFEHFTGICEAINTLGGEGLWDEQDGFYYDKLLIENEVLPMRIRSMVGLLPLCAVEILDDAMIDALPGFRKRMEWFLKNQPGLARHVSYCETGMSESCGKRLLALPSRPRLERMLKRLVNEAEFLSPHGIRSLSKEHGEKPFVFRYHGTEEQVSYVPGESDSWLFGGNSNWRGPIWFPVNYLLIEALERYHYFYGNSFQLEYPSGSGQQKNLQEIAEDLKRRLLGLFRQDALGERPCHGRQKQRHAREAHWQDLLLYHEYFHGETGQGLGASHQTGWTALVTRLLT
ncbi:MAG: glucosidase [Blastochloris sp.]|nr:glucosidase [Blastochloris sp.]